MRRSSFVAVVLLIPAWVDASGHNFDAAMGLSRVGKTPRQEARVSGAQSVNETDDSGVYGWHLVGAVTFHGTMRSFAVVGDVSGHFKEFGRAANFTRDIQQVTFMVGPRWETPIIKLGKYRLAKLMVHTLPFGFRFDNQANTETAMVASAGGSLEVKFHWLTTAGFGARVIYDRLFIRNVRDQNRWSVVVSRRFAD